jgi:hypothetical protein
MDASMSFCEPVGTDPIEPSENIPSIPDTSEELTLLTKKPQWTEDSDSEETHIRLNLSRRYPERSIGGPATDALQIWTCLVSTSPTHGPCGCIP